MNTAIKNGCDAPTSHPSNNSQRIYTSDELNFNTKKQNSRNLAKKSKKITSSVIVDFYLEVEIQPPESGRSAFWTCTVRTGELNLCESHSAQSASHAIKRAISSINIEKTVIDEAVFVCDSIKMATEQQSFNFDQFREKKT